MDYDLFQIILFLYHAMSLLNLIAISGLPHVVIGHYALHRFPGELGRINGVVCVCVCEGGRECECVCWIGEVLYLLTM